MIKSLICAFTIILSTLSSAPPDQEFHQFSGKHFLASYMGCDLEAIGNVDGMIAAMTEAVLSSGATILSSLPYIFEPNGLTMVFLLSESHGSIHTYPEHGACFVDLFTCGDNCSSEQFDKILRDYLKPKEINARLFLRHSEIEETFIR